MPWTRRLRRSKRRQSGRFAEKPGRRLVLESLERREVLSGVVTATVTDGNLRLDGDSLDNQVTLQSNGPNSFVVRGVNGTSVVDELGSMKSSHIVNGVTGSITVSLDPEIQPANSNSIVSKPANDSFTVVAQSDGQPSFVPTDLNIYNRGARDVNVIGDVNIGGNLNIATQDGGSARGTQNTIRNVGITGDAVVANEQLSTTRITASTIGGDLLVTNGSGAATEIGDQSERNYVLGNVVILNDSTNKNTITNTAIGGGGGPSQGATGGLWIVKKDDVGSGSQELTIQDNTNVFGPTIVVNFSVQTGPVPEPDGPIEPATYTGGTTKLVITNSQLRGHELMRETEDGYDEEIEIVDDDAIELFNDVQVGFTDLALATMLAPPLNLPSSLAQNATPSSSSGNGMVTPGRPVYIPLTGTIPALLVHNGQGLDTILVQGAMTTIGDGVPQIYGSDSLADAVQINNRDGGGLVSFGPTATDPATSRLSIQGGMTIENGFNADGVIDTTVLHATVVTGRVYVYNAGGAGATNTMIHNSHLGTTQTGGPLGNPLAVFNDAGPDVFAMSSSRVPWGAFINHDSNPSPTSRGDEGPTDGEGLGTSLASTTIKGGQIGKRPGGPANVQFTQLPNGELGALSASLSEAFPTQAVATSLGMLPGAAEPLHFFHPFESGDGLGIAGSAGNDTVNITEASDATMPLEIGGFVDIVTSYGNLNGSSSDLPDSIQIVGNPTSPTRLESLAILSGNAADTILLQDIVIVGAPQLPLAASGPDGITPVSLLIFTDGGIDVLTVGNNVAILPGAAPFVVILSGGTTTDGDLLIDPNGVMAPFQTFGQVLFP